MKATAIKDLWRPIASKAVRMVRFPIALWSNGLRRGAVAHKRCRDQIRHLAVGLGGHN